MKRAPLFFTALALVFASCAASRHDAFSGASGGAGFGSGGLPADDLRNSPALSSDATLPPLHGPATGSANAYYNSLGSAVTLPPAGSTAGGTSPLVGVVPGGGTWPQ